MIELTWAQLGFGAILLTAIGLEVAWRSWSVPSWWRHARMPAAGLLGLLVGLLLRQKTPHESKADSEDEAKSGPDRTPVRDVDDVVSDAVADALDGVPVEDRSAVADDLGWLDEGR